MCKKIIVFVILTLSLYLFSEISETVLAVNGEESELIYDLESGIYRSQNCIYLTYYRKWIAEGAIHLSLKFAKSSGDYLSFSETSIADFEIPFYYNPELEISAKFAPKIAYLENCEIIIFYIDPVYGNTKAAVSENGGEDFEIHNHSESGFFYEIIQIEDTEEAQYAALTVDTNVSLASYNYLTNYECSENDEYTQSDVVKFWGADEVFGPVHSNDSIWLQYSSGWPVFHSRVTTNDIFRLYPTGEPAIGNVPVEDIFLGGYEEHSGRLVNFQSKIRENSYDLVESRNHDILYVQIDGTNALCRYCDIVTEPDTFTVYNSFPDANHPNFAIGDSIWTNYVNVKKLDWADETFPLQIINSSVFVHCQLWIEGEVAGMQTWGCADTIFITGDLTYEDVVPGEAPGLESSSMLGLVSEERIYIQYKMRDPVSGEILAPNTDDIWLYGNFSAMSDGDIELHGSQNTHYEGIFSFYYQHPHGSTQPFTIELPNGTLWEVEYPDFHKFIFPPSPYWSGDPLFLLHGNQPVANNNGFYTCGYPYENPMYGDTSVPPYGTDWPWYNPVWPEASNPGMGERGTIHLYGGVQQYRRGFVHRSGLDPFNHPSEMEWDIEHWHYDGTHGPTGYDKDYHWDERLDNGVFPPDYTTASRFNLSGFNCSDSCAICLFTLDEGELTEVARFDMPYLNSSLIDVCFTADHYLFLLAEKNEFEEINTRILQYDSENWNVLDLVNAIPDPVSIDIFNGNYLIKSMNGLHVVNQTGEIEETWNLNQISELADYTDVSGEFLHYIIAEEEENHYRIYSSAAAGEFQIRGDFNLELSCLDSLSSPEFAVNLHESDSVVLQFLNRSGNNSGSYDKIYLAAGNVSEVVGLHENEIPESELNYQIYPNPFNPRTTISFSLYQTEEVNIAVYNVKGQKVEELLNEKMPAGAHQVIWDAENKASGLYFLVFKSDSYQQISKLVLLK